jgi:hypothetical protein
MPDDARAPRGPHSWTTTTGLADPVTQGVRVSGAPYASEDAAGTQPCPCCGHPMPDLKGGRGTICGVCGFKDSCCF